MKTSIKGFIALLAGFALAGCGSSGGGTSVQGGRVLQAGANSWSANGTSGTFNGVVTSTDQNSFQQAVQELAGFVIAPSSVGQVSAQAQGGTGVYFGGRVSIQSNSSQGAAINPNSVLVIGIYDQYVAQGAKAIEIVMSQATGQVSGNNVSVRFQASNGLIELDGVVSGSAFTGTLSFDLQTDAAGNPGQAWTMGNFSIPTSSFFTLN